MTKNAGFVPAFQSVKKVTHEGGFFVVDMV